MPRGQSLRRSRALLGALLIGSALAGAAAGCRREAAPADRREQELRREYERVKAELDRRARERPRAPAGRASAAPLPPAPSTEPASEGAAGEPAPSALSEEAAKMLASAPFVIDEPVTVGPSGPATATAFGVVMNTSSGELHLSPLGKLSGSERPVKTPTPPLPEGAGPFALGRGPSVTGDRVYWISHGSLVRRRLGPRGATSDLEILARDAHDGTRVGVPIPGGGAASAKRPETAAYIVRPEKEGAPLLARLWTEGAPPELLTAEGNSTHSVSLVETSDGVLAVSVQARMAMTPIHARRVTFEGGKPRLADDTVVWVGGGIQPLTEIALLPIDRDRLLGYIPHERSMTEFGMAELDIGMKPDMDTPTAWILYPNGIDPSPVATGRLCGAPVVVYAEPETAKVDARQELVLRAVGAASSIRIASAPAIYFVSFAAVPGGGLAVWVTNEGATVAATLRCKKPMGR